MQIAFPFFPKNLANFAVKLHKQNLPNLALHSLRKTLRTLRLTQQI